ncbi:Protease 3 precursor [Pseudovibrio axinellae]|uniref:Protease 3 n=1 Tax=Pseudovibrio axinellae TaxID=989403 RepID=A0A165YCA5_9HYPH|nr:pitrilysin family protein [Pseudovibrio axinellae]KZL18710.1 Protease 3 precursor [Pseudovibrio axinellae]SEP95835.1 zinc protease [Pseudovibrio axinellae]
MTGRSLTLKALALSLVVFASPTLSLAASTTGKASIEDFSKIRIGGTDVSQSTLANGLQVVVIPDRRAPIVTHMIWYKVGAADEAPGKSGLAHFLEHLMFKGTKNTPEGEFSQKVAQVGGQENAFTSQDYTAYYQQVAKEHLEMVMGYEADRMSNLILTEEQIIPERDVVLEERSQRVDRSPAARLSETFDQVLFPNSPYGIPVIGWKDEIQSLNKDDAIAFYDKYYTPNNAVLIVAGDVSADEVLKLANKTYGKVEQRAEPGARLRPHVQIVPGNRAVTLESDQVAQPSLKHGWIVPSSTTADAHESEALGILADIVGGGANSRLYKELVVKGKMATSAGTWYQSTTLDDTRFILYVAPKDGTNLEELEQQALTVIDDVLENGVSAEEVERSKRSMLASAIYSQDKQDVLARIFGSALVTGGSVEKVQTWPERVAQVTPEQVQAVAQKYLSKTSVASYLSPAPKPENVE